MLTLNRWEPTCRDSKTQGHGQAAMRPELLIAGLPTELQVAGPSFAQKGSLRKEVRKASLLPQGLCS